MKAGSLSFDILVIDEASQMRPKTRSRDAAIQTDVVVGDQKQLPPTDFFARSETRVGRRRRFRGPGRRIHSSKVVRDFVNADRFDGTTEAGARA